MLEAINGAIQVSLNKELWVHTKKWFNNLQDDGEDLTEEEMKEWKIQIQARKINILIITWTRKNRLVDSKHVPMLQADKTMISKSLLISNNILY